MSSIVAVHGLGSNGEKAWTHRGTGANWLRDLLPRDLRDVRVITVNHDSSWQEKSPMQSLGDYGRMILNSIGSIRIRKEVRSLVATTTRS